MRTEACASNQHEEIDRLNSSAQRLRDKDPKQALALGQTAYARASALGYPRGIAESLATLAHSHSWQDKHRLSLSQGLDALALFEQLSDLKGQADALCAVANARWHLSDYSQALEEALRALALARKAGDRVCEAFALHITGITYSLTGDEAQAANFFSEALAIYQAVEDKAWQAYLLNSLTMASYRAGHYAKALTFGHEGLQLAREMGHKVFEGYLLGTLGEAYLASGEADESLRYLTAAAQIARDAGLKYLEQGAAFFMGEVHRQRNQADRALAYFQQALALAEETASMHDVFLCHQSLAQTYESLNDFQQALTHYKKFHAVSENVFNEENALKISRLQMRYAAEAARKEAEIYQLKNVELEQAYRQLQENQQKLIISEKMASLGRLTGGIAHELNTPLAAVRAALMRAEQLVDEYEQSLGDASVTLADHQAIAQDLKQALRVISNSAERAASFIRSVKSQTRTGMAEKPQHFSAVTVIEETLLALTHTAQKAGCTVSFQKVGDKFDLYGLPGQLVQVVAHLVTNALEASLPGGGVALRLESHPENLTLQVSDRGSGISPEHLTRIFDPMFTTKPFGKSTGLGLTIVHDIVVGEFGGLIQVESQLGEGATFTLVFPLPQFT